MARPARGEYPCKVCPEILGSPGALGGHMSAHVRRGEVPPVITGDARLAAQIVERPDPTVPRRSSGLGLLVYVIALAVVVLAVVLLR